MRGKSDSRNAWGNEAERVGWTVVLENLLRLKRFSLRTQMKSRRFAGGLVRELKIQDSKLQGKVWIACLFFRYGGGADWVVVLRGSTLTRCLADPMLTCKRTERFTPCGRSVVKL